MGREATAFIKYGGQSGDGRILLEADEVIIRGEVKGRIGRSSLVNPRVEGDNLVLDAPDGLLAIRLGTIEAERWIKALARPTPTLAEKLGLQAGGGIWVWGHFNDSALNAALTEGRPEQPEKAALHVAVVNSKDDLSNAIAERGDSAAPLWLVYRKGTSDFGDTAIRSVMREVGYIDSKSCSVSEVLTATRYGRRRT